MKKLVLCAGLVAALVVPPRAIAWISFLDGGLLPREQGWLLDGSDAGAIVDLSNGNSGIQQSDDTADGYDEWYVVNAATASTLAARFRVDAYGGGPANILQLTTANSSADPCPALAVAIREGRLLLIRWRADSGGAPVEDARLADLGLVELDVFYEAHLYIDNATDRVRLFWNGELRYSSVDSNPAYQHALGEGRAEFGASNYWPENDRSGTSTITFDWVGLGDISDLPLSLPFVPWTLYLDGSTQPEAPWIPYSEGEAGTSEVIDFIDPANGASGHAVRINSGSGLNEWYVGAFFEGEVFGGARFKVEDFSATGKENLIAITTESDPLAPAPSITIVDGRFKLWSYVSATEPFGQYQGFEIADIGPVATQEWHTAYLYARKDGRVRLWWDGHLLFDTNAPLVNPFGGYFEWGSGSWQRDAIDTVDFDWVAYGAQNVLAALTPFPTNGSIFQDANAGFSFTHMSGDGVASNGISITVNGVDRSGDLVISGDNNNRQGFLGGLLANTLYNVVVMITEVDGDTFGYPIVFDTFSPSNFVFEAEDWNIDGGQFIDDPVLSSDVFELNSYFGKTSLEDIDHNELDVDPGASRHAYRDFALVGTEQTGDIVRQKYADAQITDPAVTDYNVGWVELDEWLNYSRTFPVGVFYIYGRFADGNIDQFFEATLEKVAGATMENQTTTSLGVFRGGPGRGWQTYDWVPLTDNQMSPVVLELNGVETLRVTCTQGGYNANFYMLVPAPPRLQITQSNGNVSIGWTGSGFTLQCAPSINGSWASVQNQSNPFTVAPLLAAQFYRLVGPAAADLPPSR